MASSSSSLFAVSSFAIPLALVAAALFQLESTGLLDEIVKTFFACSVAQQVSLLCLVGSVVFVAVRVSTMTATTANTPTSTLTPPTTIDYPLEEIRAATTIKSKFQTVFPLLRQEILEHLQQHDMPQEALDWNEAMLNYNVPGGKLNRGTTVVSVCESLLDGGGVRSSSTTDTSLSDVQVARASVLGWAIEFLQAFFLVADDVMDESQTRRGQPCWYKRPDVQLIAINDSFLLESYVFFLLKRHFGHEPYYHDLVDLFLTVVQKTEFGQLLDLTSQPMNGTNAGNATKAAKIDLTRFTLDRYRQIVKYKTAYYTFYLPIAIGMITSGVTESTAFEQAERICCIMGEYFQIQDDYLDCYGDPETIGKVGTDIQDNKCSWLVVQALDRASPAQRKVLQDNYGQWDDKKVAKVKALYKELELEKVFANYEEESYRQIQAELDKVTLMPREAFEVLLNKIYKRSK